MGTVDTDNGGKGRSFGPSKTFRSVIHISTADVYSELDGHALGGHWHTMPQIGDIPSFLVEIDKFSIDNRSSDIISAPARCAWSSPWTIKTKVGDTP